MIKWLLAPGYSLPNFFFWLGEQCLSWLFCPRILRWLKWNGYVRDKNYSRCLQPKIRRWWETKWRWKHSGFRSDSESVDSNEEWMLFSNTACKCLFHIWYAMEMLRLGSGTAKSEFWKTVIFKKLVDNPKYATFPPWPKLRMILQLWPLQWLKVTWVLL